MKNKTYISILLLILLFSSCAVKKYDYYYTKLTPANSDIAQTGNNWFCLKTAIQQSESTLEMKDSISFFMDVNANTINLYLDNTIPIYIDFPKTRIIVNDTIFRLSSTGVDHLGIKYLEAKSRSIKRPLNSDARFGHISFSEDYFGKIYDKYNDKAYTDLQYRIQNKNRKIPTLTFSDENTPLYIKAEIIYYTTPDYADMHLATIDLYQSALLKAKNLRGEQHKQKEYWLGHDIAYDAEDVAFFMRKPTGSIWGWPECRHALLQGGYYTAIGIGAAIWLVLELKYEEFIEE